MGDVTMKPAVIKNTDSCYCSSMYTIHSTEQTRQYIASNHKRQRVTAAESLIQLTGVKIYVTCTKLPIKVGRYVDLYFLP